jgi:hypothetical protein
LQVIGNSRFLVLSSRNVKGFDDELGSTIRIPGFADLLPNGLPLLSG